MIAARDLIKPRMHRGADGEHLSRILTTHPHMAESAPWSYRMWGDDVGAIMDRSDGRAESGIAWSGQIVGTGGSGSGTSHPAVAGRLDQRADLGGVLRTGRQRAPLALDLRPRGRRGSARPQGTRPAPVKARVALSVIEELLTPGVSDRPNWTLPRLTDEIEKRTGERISKSRLSVVLKKGALPGAGRATR